MSIEKRMVELLSVSLGDGSINKSGYISIRHCLAQIEYVVWKYNLIKDYCDTEPYFVKNNSYGAIEFRTRSCREIKFLKRILYKDKKKLITPRLLKKIGILGLAILYLDDGSLCAKKRKGKIHAYDLTISLYLSDEREINDIISFINKEYSLSFTTKRNKGLFSIRCGTKSARKFINMIKPFIPDFDCFKHSKLKPF